MSNRKGGTGIEPQVQSVKPRRTADTVLFYSDLSCCGHPFKAGGLRQRRASPALFFQESGDVMTLDQGCAVGLFDRIEDMEPRSFQYEGEGHLVMYTDGLLELVEGGHDEKLDYLKEHLGGPSLERR